VEIRLSKSEEKILDIEIQEMIQENAVEDVAPY
jgi:hypothetical protein